MSDLSTIYDDKYYLELPVDSGRIEAILRLLDLESDAVVCEIGCAAGHFLAAIASQINHGVGLDTAEAAIRAAIQTKEKYNLQNIEFVGKSVQEYAAVSDRSYQCDYVFLLDVAEHIDDYVMLEVLDASRRLLKSDGRLVIHTPNLGYWLEQLKLRNIVPQLEGHIAVRNFTQCASLLEQAGFTVEQHLNLPHYRQPFRFVDAILLHVPLINSLFASRLFVVASKDG